MDSVTVHGKIQESPYPGMFLPKDGGNRQLNHTVLAVKLSNSDSMA